MIRRLAVFLGVSALVACGDKVVGATPTTTTPVDCNLSGVTVTPAQVTLKVGDTVRLKASGGTCGQPPLTFFWKTSSTLASIESASGLLTALKPGAVTAIATAVQNPAIQGAAAVTITP